MVGLPLQSQAAFAAATAFRRTGPLPSVMAKKSSMTKASAVLPRAVHAASQVRKHKRQRSRRLWCEPLERRDLLAATLEAIHLVNDTGSPGELTTTDLQVAGTVTGFDAGNSVEIQFDHFADGTVNGSVSAGTLGQECTYDPRWFDYALAS